MMFYVFETIDKHGSRRRIVYSHLKNALNHILRFKKLPKIRRNANDLR